MKSSGHLANIPEGCDSQTSHLRLGDVHAMVYKAVPKIKLISDFLSHTYICSAVLRHKGLSLDILRMHGSLGHGQAMFIHAMNHTYGFNGIEAPMQIRHDTHLGTQGLAQGGDFLHIPLIGNNRGKLDGVKVFLYPFLSQFHPFR